MISLDCESTGLDVFHGAAPFFVTTCQEDGTQVFYEWPVDPETRIVDVPDIDRDEIRELVLSAESIIGQNIKYDSSLLVQYGVLESWPWERTHDTLVAGHLLASNQPHDLTSMAMHYLGIDIEPYEKELEVACKDARRMVQQAQLRVKRYSAKLAPSLFGPTVRHPAGSEPVKGDEPLARYRIAGPDQPDMPSAKEKSWKYDGWLPKALAKELGYAGDHPWQTVLRDYGNADSAVTLALWRVMREELHKRGLYSIYLEKLKNLAHVYDMQRIGVTVLVPALNRLETEYEGEYERMENRCMEIARGLNYELTLPKGSANNKSLSTFLFETLKLPVRKWTPTGNPAFDKDVIEGYRRALEGTPLEFIKNLSGRRKRGKSLEFMDSYRRYGIRNGRADVLILHPNLNPTATATTRFGCDNPNLQQVSKQETACELCEGDGCEVCGWSGEDLHSVRQIFGPGPGREWWTADAENIELRIPAYRSGQKELIELFERPLDPPFYGSQHLLNFSVVYPDVWTEALLKVGLGEVGPYVKKKHASDYYQWCKNGDFAIQYQCGEATADRAFHRTGAFRTLKSAFAQLESLNQYYVSFAEKWGYVETLPDKTVNPQHGYPLMCTRTEYGRVLPTLPLNYMSQGTAGWWMVKAINRCGEQLKEWRTMGFDAWMVLTVHDELVFDFPSGFAGSTGFTNFAGRKRNLPKMRRLKQLMEMGGDDVGVPTPVSVSYHPRNWAEKVKL